MTRIKRALLFALLLGGVSSGAAYADRGHFHGGPRVGVVIGAPLFWPWYYGPPYYAPYYYPPAVVPSAPPVYIEQAEQPAAPSPQANSWYYCAKPQGYYPYVTECPGGWQQVPPQPPPPRR